MVDYKNNVYIWGGNNQGQLGLGHPRHVNAIVNLSSLGKNIRSVAVKGKESYIVTGDGGVLKWPNKSDVKNKFNPFPIRISSPQIKFRDISCGYGFAVGLTENGLLLSYGQNEMGQLGLDDFNDRS